MTSRLDRLLTLVEKGTSGTIRSVAATQIGEIQKAHPEDLPVLLDRVLVLLKSKEWDTRIAASQTLGAICKNVPVIWNISLEEEVEESKVDVIGEEYEDSMTFDKFDIERVLQYGVPLLASGGKEFDEELVETDPKKRIAAQKKNLKKRLGLDLDMQYTNIKEIIHDEDLSASSSSKLTKRERKRKQDAENEAKKLSDKVLAQQLPSMSARELNTAKRKARKQPRTTAAPQSNSAVTKTIVTQQPKSEDKIVVETVRDREAAFRDDQWPFENECQQLLNKLFDAQWEVRHGAALGLREILRKHGGGAGIEKTCTNLEKRKKRHHAWLEDCTLRLLCVLALDRFADYHLDKVSTTWFFPYCSTIFVPVRETCSQTLGTVIKCIPQRHHDLLTMDMKQSSVLKVLRVLSILQRRQEWEVRLTGFIALKYAVAIRTDIVAESTLPSILDSIILGLQDKDDDVRAVAAETLQPIVQQVIRVVPHRIQDILVILWDTLLTIDDLSASTSSIMDLMATLYSENLNLTEAHQNKKRKTYEQGARVFIVCRNHQQEEDTPHVLSSLVPRLWPFLRHKVVAVRLATLKTLSKLLTMTGVDHPQWWIMPLLSDALQLVFQNILLESHKEIILESYHVWKLLVDITSEEVVYARCRVLFSNWVTLACTPPSVSLDSSLLLTAAYKYSSGVLSLGAHDGTATDSAASYTRSMMAGKCLGLLCRHRWPPSHVDEIHSILYAKLRSNTAYAVQISCCILWEWYQGGHVAVSHSLTSCLEDFLSLPPEKAMYQEVTSIMAQLRSDCEVLLLSLVNLGAELTDDILNFNLESLTVDTAMQLATDIFTAHSKEISRSVKELESRRERIVGTVQVMQQEVMKAHIRTQAAASGALIAMDQLKGKQAPLITPLTNSLKEEENEELQRVTAEHLAEFIVKNNVVKPATNDKLVANLITLLSCGVTSGVREGTNVPERGSTMALAALANLLGDQLFMVLPKLWSSIYEPLRDPVLDESSLSSLHLLWVLVPHLHFALHTKIIPLLPVILHFLSVGKNTWRTKAARCIAICCKYRYSVISAYFLIYYTVASIQFVLHDVLPLLQKVEQPLSRLGATETVENIIVEMEISLLPYLVFFIAPVLAGMTDQDITIREKMSRCFAQLVTLMPLECSAPDAPDLPVELVERRQKERHFIEQLLDSSKIDKYEIPVKIHTELRKYQQDGVNWLGFLNRYRLHGILCDDMGLGKTLMSICVMASDTFYRQQANEPSLPSLVVCPSSVVGHWYQEITKFCDVLVPAIYMGGSQKRAKLRESFKNYSVIITSYETLRNDIEELSVETFNYCVLDEGHIIRNPKVKTTQATKSIRAKHRLILSGTPVQNNVLDLWSLFDFLMPGFLGTEQQFYAKFGKPIMESHSTRGVTQEQEEAGTIALEALHKQVLPFILRRMKEDVLQDLPPKIIQDYYCDLSPLQIKLYESFAKTKTESSSQRIFFSKTIFFMYSDVFQALQYLRKVCNHPLLVLHPQHPEYESVIKEYDVEALHDLSVAPKLQALKQLLNDCGIGLETQEEIGDQQMLAPVCQHRVLIFAQLKSLLDIIETDLLQKHLPSVTYLRLDGSVEVTKRHTIVNKFNEDPTIDCLLLTTHVGGLGLNLTGADVVIFMEHDWNPSKDLQAMDRAHRIGAKKTVNVYRLITRGTLEEKVMGIQKFKQHVAKSIINEENTSIQTMGMNQILDLFHFTPGASTDKTTEKGEPESFDTNSTSHELHLLDTIPEEWEQQYQQEFDLGQFIDAMKSD